MRNVFRNYQTKTLIGILESGTDDSFLYCDVMDELVRRDKKNRDIEAFHFLIQCDLNDKALGG